MDNDVRLFTLNNSPSPSELLEYLKIVNTNFIILCTSNLNHFKRMFVP